VIADLDETLRQLLIAEIPVKNGEIEISFEQPKREWSARLQRPTANLFLYDLRENPTLRQHGWEQLPGNGDHLARLKRTPFRVDCLYMLTTWAAEPDDEHRLMTRCLLALFRYPVLPADRLVGGLQHQPFEIQARLASHDRLTNPAEVWSALDNEMRPSVSYILTLALDPWAEMSEQVVRTLAFRFGQAGDLPANPRVIAGEPFGRSVWVGGTVRTAQKETPQAGIQVAVKGTGLFTTTDGQGRFRLGSLPEGVWTLVAWPTEGGPREKTVQVPAEDGNYDIEIPEKG
jgi:hypothetical protein